MSLEISKSLQRVASVAVESAVSVQLSLGDVLDLAEVVHVWLPSMRELTRLLAEHAHSAAAAAAASAARTAPGTLELSLAATDVLLMDDTLAASDRYVRQLLRVRLREWHSHGELEWLGGGGAEKSLLFESAFRSLRCDYFNPALHEWEPLVEPLALSVQYHERGTVRVVDVSTAAQVPVNVTVSTAFLGLVARMRELLSTLIATTRRVTFSAEFPALAQVAAELAPAPAELALLEPHRRRVVRLVSRCLPWPSCVSL